MIDPWIGIGLVLATFTTLFAVFSHIGPLLAPEVLRKSLHVAIGLTALSFPWLFQSKWPVVLVIASCTVAFIALHAGLPLLGRLRTALSRIKRASVGEFCFVAATAILFLLAAKDPVLYCIPLLLLTLADAAAALVGTAFGRHRFATLWDYKSIEGSAAFFVTAFVCIAAPLAWFTPATLAQAIAVAALIALATTLLEAAIGGGFDNLLVPLGAFAAIKATGLTAGRPDALASGSPVAVAALALALAVALLVLLVVARTTWRGGGARLRLRESLNESHVERVRRKA
jgi:phytol kinase